ncbi:MAG: T9SS type A sorting domain-containing protein [Bacteroidetes bacterium]|nr:T9SS type A sorting domain-containing protein [Bacteroidota bacterium]
MKFKFPFFLIIPISLLLFNTSHATTWRVGPNRTYIKPSAVASLVQNGDTVDIDSATYTADVCSWTKNNLLLRGVGGKAHLNANNTSFGRKAIWLITGANTTVENIEFSHCHDVAALDQNWAGIRQEGANLTVTNAYFHDNDNGILANGVAGSKINIQYAEFAQNGFGDGFSHNLYINAIDTLVFRYNYSHGAKIGHELKSRAHNNFILYNRLSNETGGTASRNIDLPQGGLAIVMGNVFHQSSTTSNSNMVGYKLEGTANPAPHNFYLINNTFCSDRNNTVFVSLGAGVNLYKGYNNIFAGPVAATLSGTATTIDTMANIYFANIAAAGFANSANYDYHPLSASLAVNKGVNAGIAANGQALTPSAEYLHPKNKTTKTMFNAIDPGAYEFVDTILPIINIDSATITIGENGGSIQVPITINYVKGNAVTATFSLTGTAAQNTDYTANPSTSVTFPSNAANGSQQMIQFNILPDNLTEGIENIIITITPTNAQYNLGNASKTIQITNFNFGMNLQNALSKTSIYPNPTSDYLHLCTEDLLVNSEWKIFDALGRIRLTGKIKNTETIIPMVDLERGVYYLNVGGRAGCKL